jgi:hypothetical protein
MKREEEEEARLNNFTHFHSHIHLTASVCSMFRCFLPSVRYAIGGPHPVSSVRGYVKDNKDAHIDPSHIFGKREKTLEDLAVKEHEAELIKKYREELKVILFFFFEENE